MPYYHNNTTRLYYEIHGEPDSLKVDETLTPLILISGLGGDLGFWGDSIARLKDQFQLIVFDNRGIGRSDAPDEPYSLELFADDLACLLNELQIESAHVLGFSMGGSIAQAFALKYPERLRKLIIAASYAKMSRQAELFLDGVLSVYETGATNKQMFELILPWLFSASFLSKSENEGVLEFDENDPMQQPLYAFRRQYQAQRAFDSRGELQKIQAETLVLGAERDALVPIEDAKELARLIPQSSFVAIPESGHLMNVEQADLFHSHMVTFLSEKSNR